MTNSSAVRRAPQRRRIAVVLALLLVVTGCTHPLGDGQATRPTTRGAGASDATGPEPQPPFNESLGQPLTAMVAGSSGYAETDAGRPVVALVAGGQPAQFSLLDSQTGSLIHTEPLHTDTTSMVMATAFATDPLSGDIYFGDSKGRAYRVDPDAPRLRVLPRASDGGVNFQSAAAMPDGRILFTSYPDASLRIYDPQADAWSTVAEIGGGAKYLKGVATDGVVAYVGTATANPRVVEVEIATGEVREIGPRAADVGFMYDVALVGDHVYARVDESGEIHVYDRIARRWLESPIRGSRRGLATPEGGSAEEAAGLLYWLDGGGRLMRYDPAERTSARVGDWAGLGSLRGSARQMLPGGGRGLVTITTGGRLMGVDEATGRTVGVPLDAAEAPQLIRSVGTAPDGRVSVGAYGTAPYFAAFDPSAESWRKYDVRGQIEGFASDAHGTVFGMYPSGRIGFIPAGAPADTRPRIVGTLGHRQQRPMAILPLGDAVYAVASFPEFGRLGGALSIVDTRADSIDVYEDISADQTPLSLARVGDTLYVGLGTGGGLGSTATTGEAGIAVFDLTSRTVVDRFVPIESAQNVSSLAPDGTGAVWGVTGSTIFRLDTRTRAVTREKTYDTFDDRQPYVRGRTLHADRSGLWANMRGRIFRVDKDTLERTEVATGANAVQTPDGALYYSVGSTLHRYVPEGPNHAE